MIAAIGELNRLDEMKEFRHNIASPAQVEEIAGIAQLVERNLAKVEVASSSLVSRSSFTGPRKGLCFSPAPAVRGDASGREWRSGKAAF